MRVKMRAFIRILSAALLLCATAWGVSAIKRGYVVGETLHEVVGTPPAVNNDFTGTNNSYSGTPNDSVTP
jgi:hypothetical protein